MSRAVSLDWPADHHSFARLIDLARGNRTLKQYSSDAGVNCAYLSKVSSPTSTINATPTFIGRLSVVAANGVTYDQLMQSAGYDPLRHPIRVFGKMMGSSPSSDYENGIIKGMFILRNSIFDLLSKGDVTIDDVIHTICTADNIRHNEKNVEEKSLKPGFVVKQTGADNEYIVVSTMEKSCIVISPEGRFQTLKLDKLIFTGHKLDEKHLEKLVSRIER